jgi:hypothetical protein
MKTINRQMRDAMRPVKQDLRQPPRRVLVARVKEAEANEWIGFIGRNTDIVPLRMKK